ncbi:hypothetical protein QQ045_015600 [Rhodiola kirilowii]
MKVFSLILLIINRTNCHSSTIPLHIRSLKPNKYNGIINNMTEKIKAWSARKLSYDDSVVLIKHVLRSLCSFWTSVLIFPSFIMMKFIILSRNYLWSGLYAGSRSLVAWDTVSKLKSNVGLDLKNLMTFNKSLALSQLWDLSLKKDSLWIKLIHNYFFKTTILGNGRKSHRSRVLKKS